MNLNAGSEVRALLVDLDGVLRLWPRTDANVEGSHGLPDGAIRATAFAPELILEAIEGRISDEAWRLTVESRLLQKYPKAAVASAVRAWSVPVGRVNEPVLNLVRQARRQVPVVLITNATSRLNRDLAALKLLTEFDAIINSSVVQAAKPSAIIYAEALAAAQVTAAEALFVDDQAVNVTAAAKLGIHAHHFTCHEGLSAELAASGLLRRAA